MDNCTEIHLNVRTFVRTFTKMSDICDIRQNVRTFVWTFAKMMSEICTKIRTDIRQNGHCTDICQNVWTLYRHLYGHSPKCMDIRT